MSRRLRTLWATTAIMVFSLVGANSILQSGAAFRQDASPGISTRLPDAISAQYHPQASLPDMAADCALEPTGQNYTGVRYKAALLEDNLSQNQWMLLFGGNGFTSDGEYQPHFMDLMIKGHWASLYSDPLCANGFPAVREERRTFTVQFGLSDYEDGNPALIHNNDIGARSRDPLLFPRMFTNIDSTNPDAADKIMTDYQVDVGGSLEGREIEVSFIREETTTLSLSQNYFMDPDYDGALLCRPNSQDDILYRHWVATLVVPSLQITTSVDFYINAAQGDKIIGTNALNFMWETRHRETRSSGPMLSTSCGRIQAARGLRLIDTESLYTNQRCGFSPGCGLEQRDSLWTSGRR